MQNPWSSERFHGNWSDASDLWTQQFKDEAGWTSADDGVFFMSFEDYFNQCSETYFNVDTSDWYHDSFLMLNDNSQAQNPGRYSWCGSSCTRHVLTLTSSVDQDVYLTAHTWDDRCMANSCESWNSGLTHSIYRPGADYVMAFKYGAMQLDAFHMTAGQTMQITTEWDFTDSNKAKDWSVVAYAS